MKWEELFDVIVVGASKPGFLTNEYLSLFQVEKSGLLRNIEDKVISENEISFSVLDN